MIAKQEEIRIGMRKGKQEQHFDQLMARLHLYTFAKDGGESDTSLRIVLGGKSWDDITRIVLTAPCQYLPTC